MPTAELLRRERELRGLTLEQVADETKIPVARLAALEKGALTAEDGFYQRAQVRAYARALSLNEHQFLDQLNGDVIAAAPPVQRKPRNRPAAVGRRSPMTVAVCCGIAVAFAAIVLMDRLSRPSREADINTDQDAGAPIAEPRPAVAMATNVSPASLATVGTMEPAPARAAAPVATERVETAPTPAVSPTAAARAATPAVTQLVITSRPAGARVTVNGIGWGITPLRIRHLPEGAKRVRVTSTGYAAAERVVQVHTDQTSHVSIDLRPTQRPVAAAAP